MPFPTKSSGCWRLYPEAITQAQFNLLDSHDTARFVHQAGGDGDALRLSLLMLMALPGAPCVYYGTEVGMTGRAGPRLPPRLPVARRGGLGP